MMKKILKRTAVVGGIALALTVPAGAIAAAQPGPTGDGSATCSYDQDRDRLQLRDGTGPQHPAIVSGTTASGNGNSHRAGPLDGSGPLAYRPLDGTGNQFGR